jgi:AP-1 complex subunit beta-1
VTPRLQHANSAVVISAVKSILHFLDDVTNQETIRTVYKKLAPPLITLLNSEPEIQYVALRNINLIVLKHPKILEHEIKVFFCKYNDPIYVKMEKLEIIIRLTSERNIEQVLLELKEYATEVDVDFVRRAVRAIGRCAIKLERAAERCITVLLDLIQTKVNYVVQEAIVVIKDIFRKYPNRYEGIIATLCENLENLDEPDAKASMIWIIGEYAERIDNADELLDSFLESFLEETASVQLQLLTATVKLFLKQPESTQDMVQRVLNLATEESDNPDLRDRGYIYWRLLSTDPEAARAVVLSEKPEIGDDTVTMEPALLDELIGQIATLASIYHKPPEAFIMKTINIAGNDDEEEPEEEPLGDDDEGSTVSSNSTPSYASNTRPAGGTTTTSAKASGNIDLLDLYDSTPAAAPASKATGSQQPVGSVNLLDDLGLGNGGASSTSMSNAVVKSLIVTAEAGQGISIQGAIVKMNGKVSFEMDVANMTSTPVQALAIQFNKNAYGLTAASPGINLASPIANGNKQSVSLPMTFSPTHVNASDAMAAGPLQLQAAIKNLATNAVFYFVIPYTLDIAFTAR